MDSAKCLVNNRTEGFAAGMRISNFGLKFSPKGDKLFFNLTPVFRQTAGAAERASLASIDVMELQSTSIFTGRTNSTFKISKSAYATLQLSLIDESKIITLKKEDDGFMSTEGCER